MSITKDFYYTGQPLNEIYDLYCFHGHVPDETKKLYYWKQQKVLFELLQPLIKTWKVKKIIPDQYQTRFYKMNDTIYSTCENAPVGGMQNYTFEQTKKIATKFLSNNQHLIDSFNGKCKIDQEAAVKNQTLFPNLFGLKIICGRVRYQVDSSMCFDDSPQDIYLSINPEGCKTDSINQRVFMHIKQGALSKQSKKSLINKMSKLIYAKHIWHSEAPFNYYTYDAMNDCIGIRYPGFSKVENAKEGKNIWGSEWVDLLSQ